MRGSFLAAVALAAASISDVASAAKPEPPTVVPDAVYVAPQQLVIVERDRRLNLWCAGSGAPTVMLEAGAGDTLATWRFIQGEIAKTTRACAYDRAGLGFSDAADRASDVRNMADDLARLVSSAGLGKPVVLVGHSLGAEIAVYLAADAPDEVAGLVLVDPAFANDVDALQSALPNEKRGAIQNAMSHGLDARRACLDRARAGALARPSSAADRACLNLSGDPNRLDRALAEARRKQLADPKAWEAQLSEMKALTPDGDHMDANSAQLDAAPFDFADKPLIVLSRGVGEGAPGVPPAALPRVEAAWITGHAALAARSTKGQHVIVAGARHYVQIDRPEAVVEAVTKVVKAVRDAKETKPN